jgi:glycosyltransferase involved in cell wall biosynthesis
LQYIQYEHNCGKGFALREGVKKANSEYCIFTDVDFPYAEQSVREIFNMLRSGDCDVAVGIKSKNYYKNVPWLRVRISRLLRWLVSVFLKMPITDTQCGLKGFNEKGKAVFLKTTVNRYLFDLEFLYLITKQKGVAVKSKEVELKKGVTFSRMPPTILAMEGWNFLKVLAKRI